MMKNCGTKRIVKNKYIHTVLPHDAMHSAEYAVAICLSACLSVRPSVRRTYNCIADMHICCVCK